MDRPQVYLGLTITAFSLLMLFVLIPAQYIPPMMSSVSPSFYPNIGTCILLAGGLGLLVSGIRGNAAKVDAKKLWGTVKYCGRMAAVLGLTLVVFEFVHFLAGGALLMVITMWLLGERRPFYLALVSLLSPVVIWLLIDVLLGRNLP